MATKHEAGIRLLRAAFEDRTVRTAEEMQALCNAGGGLSYRWLQEIKGELGIAAERVGPRAATAIGYGARRCRSASA